MNRRTPTNSIVETGLLTAINIILILLSIYVPGLYIIGLFLWSIPVSLTYLRNGIKYSILSVILTGILVSVMVEPITAITFVLIQGTLGLIMGYGIKNKKTLSFIFLMMTLCVFISNAIVINLSKIIIGQDLIKYMVDTINETQKTLKDTYMYFGVPEVEIDKAISMALPKSDMFVLILPTIMLGYSLVISLISYLFAYKIFSKLGYKVEKIKPLSEWYISKRLALILLSILLISYAIYSFRVDNANVYLINAQIIFAMAYTINGIATLDYYLLFRKKFKGFTRFIIIFLMVNSPLVNLFFILGAVDFVFNYRKWMREKYKE